MPGYILSQKGIEAIGLIDAYQQRFGPISDLLASALLMHWEHGKRELQSALAENKPIAWDAEGFLLMVNG